MRPDADRIFVSTTLSERRKRETKKNWPFLCASGLTSARASVFSCAPPIFFRRGGLRKKPLLSVPLILKRSSLVAQVADVIRSEIMRRAWSDWIPSERELNRTLHVSRNTCRAALHMLTCERLITPVQGRGIRVNRDVVRKAHPGDRQIHSVGLIMPEVVSRLRPTNSVLIDDIREELFDQGVRLSLHVSSACYQANPEHALEKLVGKNRHDCWILVLSNEAQQKWFMQRGIPCLVTGSIYSGIRLPSVDWDHRSICRHAIGQLIALGHRRVVFFNRFLRAAGDLESEAGFLQGARMSSHTDLKAWVVYHDDSRESVGNLISKLLANPEPPTGLIVANSYCYLSVASALAHRGYRVPEDFSLISREDDAFLAYVDPEPARYLNTTARMARKVMTLIRPLLEGGIPNFEPVRLTPRFIAGGSVRQLANVSGG
jgi:DNA-binding LacI/PurR family transcriptional regulator